MCSDHTYLQPPGLSWEGRSSNGWAECIWKAPQAVAKRSCMILEHSTHTADVFDWESIFGRVEKPEYSEKEP